MEGKKASLIVVAAAALLSCTYCPAADFKVSELHCEYLVNPIGIDTPKPRLSWIIESYNRGWRQSAYQIIVSSDEGTLNHDTGDLWDSGKVNSDESVNITYGGKALASRVKCF
jgi:alpha-L-rhamnosidase